LKKLFARFVRQSPSMIVAMLALFVALGGTAIAAGNALITGKQIKNSSITGADVKNKSLTPKDFKGSVRGLRGLRGAVGPQGAQGAQGAQGPAGAPNPNAVDSDKVDGYHANELTRVGNDFGSAGPLPPVAAPDELVFGTAGLVAPRNGYALVTATAQPNAAAGCPCRAVMQITHVQGGTTSHFAVDDVRRDIFDGFDGNLAITSVFPVAAGTNTFDLRGYYYGPASTINVSFEITAVWLPFGSDGAAVAAATAARSSSIHKNPAPGFAD
jgi:hypothetical protein